MDRTLAGLLLVALAPALLLVAAAVRVSIGSPVLYPQRRVGLDGRTFTMWKFRTMTADRRHSRQPYSGPERRRTHKTPRDPRHTRLGRWLRRYSLDELPQLWNVARGDLSLVGPRPELPNVVATYEQWQHRRHSVKPGLTGLWQVTNRDEHGRMQDFVHLDLAYVDNLSLRLDLVILLLTVPSLLLGPGHFGRIRMLSSDGGPVVEGLGRLRLGRDGDLRSSDAATDAA